MISDWWWFVIDEVVDEVMIEKVRWFVIAVVIPKGGVRQAFSQVLHSQGNNHQIQGNKVIQTHSCQWNHDHECQISSYDTLSIIMKALYSYFTPDRFKNRRPSEDWKKGIYLVIYSH